jgi:ABC-type glycerol-3-phosphate transport system substrate-binding protein
MRKLSTILLASMLSLTMAQAEGMKCGAGKCGASMNMEKSTSKLLSDMNDVDGYKIMFTSDKPLVAGNNEISVTLQKEGEAVTDAKVKVKIFMPEMPGMPYMEYKEKLKLNDKSYQGTVNFSMNGTWQYHLKFKTSDDKVHKVRGSMNI